MKLKKGALAACIILLVIVADQLLKFWVKTHFYMGEDYSITSWFHLRFIENNGMAFGLELWSKYFLTFIRLIAVAILCWVLVKVRTHDKISAGCIAAVALITAGAAGNIFDCLFYGQIFNNPIPTEVAQFMPAEGGYAPLFQGRVVDMLYFPLFRFTWPEWVPGIGGRSFEFFQYIFNIADASICVGVALLIFFFNKSFYELLNVVKKQLPFIFKSAEANDSADEK
jgi:signal peptidase II